MAKIDRKRKYRQVRPWLQDYEAMCHVPASTEHSTGYWTPRIPQSLHSAQLEILVLAANFLGKANNIDNVKS